jgi:hypothetical protein
LALPAHAQEGNVNMGYFVTSDLANVMELEEGMRAHAGWHADQNDPWPGMIYQALHGGIEYVWVSPNHTWAEIGSPPVDPQADMANFAERAGEHVTSLDVRTWVTWTDVSRPPPADAVVPIWQVIEWEVIDTAEGLQALQSAFGKVRGAGEQQGSPVRFTVNHVVGVDGKPEIFVAIAHESLDEMAGGGPNALPTLLAQTYGHADAVQIMRTFETYMTPKASRIWMLRPDLSHMPGM